MVDLDLIADGRKMAVTIDDHGRPFRTTAASNAKSYQTACELVTKSDVERALGQRMTESSGGGFQESPGAAVDLTTTSQCTYTFGRPGTQGFVPTLNVIYAAARDPSESATDQTIKSMMAPSSKWTSVAGLGDRAAATSGAILVRDGRELVLITLAPTTSVDNADDRMLQLARRLATKAWS